MGNINFLGDKLGCEDISKREYMDLRTKSWTFHEGYLYQTELEQLGDDNLKVITYEINSEDKQLKAYFQKLKMMGKYLTKGNIQIPLLCMTQTHQQCTFVVQEKTPVKFFYEQYDIHLSEEIKARQRYKQRFNEQEVWYIFYNIINALRQFEPFIEASGNLTTKEVLMNDKGKVKIKTSLTSPFQPLRSSIFNNYFAPEELEIMREVFNNEGVITRAIYKQYNINANLCQIYSLAVLLVVITTNCNHIQLYNPPFGVNQQKINKSLQKMAALGYSKLLINLLRVMLANHKNRPFPEQIYKTFKQYQFQILHFQPFSISMQSSEVRSVF